MPDITTAEKKPNPRTVAAKLRAEIDGLHIQLRASRTKALDLEEERDAARRSLKAYKGVITRLKNRIAELEAV